MQSTITLAFTMGEPVKDKLTGFKGVISGFTTYITGCDQYLVQPAMKEDGTLADAKWTDVARLQADDAGTAITLITDPAEGDHRSLGAGDAAPVK